MKKIRKALLVCTICLVCALLTGCGGKKTAVVAPAEPTLAADADTGFIALVLKDGETEKLDAVNGLKEADLRGSDCFEEIYAWSKAHPTVIVRYDVKLPDGTRVENRVSQLDLSALKGEQVEAAISCMKCLPKLVKVELGTERSGLSIGDVRRMQEALPNVRFDFAFTLYGQDATTNDTKINLYHVPVEDECAEARAAMAIMPKLEYVDMDSCGASYESMAELRELFPNVKIVWRVWFGNNYSVRTDVERILASKPSRGGMLYSGNCWPLKYCTECKYLDVGHNEELDTIDFVAYMPKLEVAILAMATWTDLSPLANCKNLEYLEIQTTPVSDLSPLAELKNLRHLNICNTSVQDISPLYGITEMERLWIGGWVNVSQDQIAKMQAAAPDCLINASAGDPTEGNWRYVGYHEEAYMFVLHPRYVLLQKQFGYHDNDYAFYWNDPLYKE